MTTAWLPGAEEGDFLQTLRAAVGADVELLTGPDVREGARVRILVRGVPTREQLVACPHLERLVIPWAGLPERTHALMRDFPEVAVHNLHHNAAPVAELALALLFALAKEIGPHDRALRRGDWGPRHAPSTVALLAGRTALVVGHGAIGRELGRRLVGLGMRVRATRARALAPCVQEGVAVHPASDLHGLLPEAFAIFLCLPLTPATRGILGEPELARLPRGSYLVNVGRGALVDETALYSALRDGRLGGAGLDVWYRYPESVEARSATRPCHARFEDLDNVVLSPHRGGHVRESEELRARALADLLRACAAGREPDNRVDLDRGY